MRGKIKRFKVFGWFVAAFKFDKPEKPKAVNIRAWDAIPRRTFEIQFAELNRGRRK